MRTTIALIFLLIPTAVWAQHPLPTAGEATGTVDTGEATDEPVRELNFKELEVNGGPKKPGGATIVVPIHGKTSSLIRVRSDFVEECLKSVDQI
jgi:hypothetical protein